VGLGLKTRRSQLVIREKDGKARVVNCEYVLGKDLHLGVLLNKDKILKIVPEMNSIKDLNGLTSI